MLRKINLTVLFLCLFSILFIPAWGRADQQDVSHQTHLSTVGSRGPGLGHKCAACHTTNTPSVSDVSYQLCIPCHSPDGSYDGLNDPVSGARYNWGRDYSMIYESDGHLKPGKKWCIGCHDNGTCRIKRVSAPNIAGQVMSGGWRTPPSIASSDIPDADNLLDHSIDTGSSSGGGYIIFDLGAKQSVSHLRLYTAPGGSQTHWEVYGGSDLVSWARIVFGSSVLFSSPTWKTAGGWNEIRLDSFMAIRYLKLVKVSAWPLSKNYLREFEVKSDLRYGYYINGHKISCDYCHDTTSAHIDGIAQTYRASLNNYQAGYRLNYVEVDGQSFPPLEIPRVGCNNGENIRTDHDFALCFACHDQYKILGDPYSPGSFFQDPPATNFRNDSQPDLNGKVRNGHLIHLQGRDACGNRLDWDSDWDGVPDSPQSCPACHNVHGSPNPAMTRHGELASTPGTADKSPMFNFQYLNADGEIDSTLTEVMESSGGKTQIYGSGPGSTEKNKTCAMCHPDQASYYRTPVATCQNCHTDKIMAQPSHYTHLQVDANGPSGCGPALSCWDCHAGSPDNPHVFLFADGQPLAKTHVCDTCHSPGGSYNGVDDPIIGAKSNWADGVYQDGRLRPGREKWCAGCHDEDPANSKADGSGVRAPAVIGDEAASYGYYKSGHGRRGLVVCTDCHDPSLPHIDHEHRTYRASRHNYQAGYRLKEINGRVALKIRNTPSRISDPTSSWQDFALCFRCHNKYELLGHSRGQGLWHKEPPFGTNFGTNCNDHYRHLAFNIRNYCDSDFDGVGDAASNCTTCHNVHGSPSAAMIRHGELISPPGTQDYVPSFDFAWLSADEDGSCTFKPIIPTAGEYQVWASWPRPIDRSLNSSHAKYRIVHADGESIVYKNERENAGKRLWNLLGTYFFDQGSYIQLTSGDIEDTVSSKPTPPRDALSYITINSLKFVSVTDGSVLLVDNPEFEGKWKQSAASKFRYYRKSKRDQNATESIGGSMLNAGNITTNHSCVGCHGRLFYAHPSLVPKTSFAPAISSARVDPSTGVTASGSPLVTAYAFDVDDDLAEVSLDLSPLARGKQLMYDDGTHGDVVAHDHIYSFRVIVPLKIPAGTYHLRLTARDATNKQDQIEVSLKVP